MKFQSSASKSADPAASCIGGGASAAGLAASAVAPTPNDAPTNIAIAAAIDIPYVPIGLAVLRSQRPDCARWRTCLFITLLQPRGIYWSSCALTRNNGRRRVQGLSPWKNIPLPGSTSTVGLSGSVARETTVAGTFEISIRKVLGMPAIKVLSDDPSK